MIPVLNKKCTQIKDVSTGFLVLINKEADWSSFDVVKKVRNIVRIKKVGHAGTLDPFATGLLILGIGKGTKHLTEKTGLSKSYRAVIRFGITTDSHDRTGNIVGESDAGKLELKTIQDALENFRGEILQKPPMFSAKQVDGVRLYHLARKNIEVERKPIPVTVHSHKILEWKNPTLTIDWQVSKGTYIRSLAHDLGQSVAVGARLEQLERTSIGQHKVEDGFTIEEFIACWREQNL